MYSQNFERVYLRVIQNTLKIIQENYESEILRGKSDSSDNTQKRNFIVLNMIKEADLAMNLIKISGNGDGDVPNVTKNAIEEENKLVDMCNYVKRMNEMKKGLASNSKYLKKKQESLVAKMNLELEEDFRLPIVGSPVRSKEDTDPFKPEQVKISNLPALPDEMLDDEEEVKQLLLKEEAITKRLQMKLDCVEENNTLNLQKYKFRVLKQKEEEGFLRDQLEEADNQNAMLKQKKYEHDFERKAFKKIQNGEFSTVDDEETEGETVDKYEGLTKEEIKAAYDNLLKERNRKKKIVRLLEEKLDRCWTRTLKHLERLQREGGQPIPKGKKTQPKKGQTPKKGVKVSKGGKKVDAPKKKKGSKNLATDKKMKKKKKTETPKSSKRKKKDRSEVKSGKSIRKKKRESAKDSERNPDIKALTKSKQVEKTSILENRKRKGSSSKSFSEDQKKQKKAAKFLKEVGGATDYQGRCKGKECTISIKNERYLLVGKEKFYYKNIIRVESLEWEPTGLLGIKKKKADQESWMNFFLILPDGKDDKEKGFVVYDNCETFEKGILQRMKNSKREELKKKGRKDDAKKKGKKDDVKKKGKKDDVKKKGKKKETKKGKKKGRKEDSKKKKIWNIYPGGYQNNQ